MAPPLTTKWKGNAQILAFLAASMCFCSLTTVALAQDPIRVESNQVLVPVIVGNKDRVRRFQRDPRSGIQAALAGDTKVIDAILESLVIRDLTAADFQILDDRKEQPIQNVSYEPSLYWDKRDNRGHHTEYIGPGGGKWSTTEWPPGVVGDVEPPHYLIAYNLPESPEGSCHQIKVKVNRRNVLVTARTEYCNTRHSSSDPLKGTEFGKQMERDLASAKDSKLDITLFAVALYLGGDAPRIQVAIDWSSESLRPNLKKIGVVGMVFDKNGRLVTRFSDLADREGVSDDWTHGGAPDRAELGVVENRYETRITLPPGEYDLRVVLSDRAKFGRAEFPLTVDVLDRKGLAISAVSLCRQVDDVSAYSPHHRPDLPGAWTAKIPGNYLPLVSNDMEFKPTANTRFKKGATLYTYFELYEPSLGGQSPATVQIQMRIVDLKTGEILSDSHPISATSYIKSGSPVIPIGRGIDINKMPTGSYRLDLKATDSAGKSTAWRTANFTVE